MGLIMRKGHSRVPIYSGSPTNIIGLILVKNLITCRTEDEIPIRNVTIRTIPRVYDDLPLYDILNEFQKGHSHMDMAVVVKCTKVAVSPTENSALGSRSDGMINPGNSSLGSRSNINGGDSTSTRQQQMRRGARQSKNILDISNTDALPSYNLDEEVVGIITMEDVMEELLQGLGTNKLSGDISYNQHQLNEFAFGRDISYNQLTGEIPFNIGFLQVATFGATKSISNIHSILYWDLSCNQLTGSIPPILGNLTYTEKLYLQENKLTGPIAPELGNMLRLHYLELNENQLTGYIPPELGKLTNLFDLDLANNFFEGPIPDHLSSCENLNSFNVHGNKLYGTIPRSF